MEMITATQIFAALGHPGRLSVFRMLMRLAPQGARPTEIAQTLGMVQNTLSHHLADLERCGLIRAERQGRSLFYSVDLACTGALVDYLVTDCCRGRPALCQTHLRNLIDMDQKSLNVLFICSGNSAPRQSKFLPSEC